MQHALDVAGTKVERSEYLTVKEEFKLNYVPVIKALIYKAYCCVNGDTLIPVEFLKICFL